MDNRRYQVYLESKPKQSIQLVVYVSTLFLLSAIFSFTITPGLLTTSTKVMIKCIGPSTSNCVSDIAQQEIQMTFTVSKFNQLVYYQVTPVSLSNLYEVINYDLILYSTDFGVYNKIAVNNQNLTINCHNNLCDPNILFYMPYIDFQHYSLLMFINDPLPVERLKFSTKKINENFTVLLICVKYVMVAASVASLGVFLWNTKGISNDYWRAETKALALMGISLVIFNEPLIYPTIAYENPRWSSVSVFCNVQFIACATLYLLFVMQSTVKWKFCDMAFFVESILVCVFFCLLFVTYLSASINFRYNPQYNLDTGFNETVMAGFVAVIVFLCIFAAKILYFFIIGMLAWNSIDLYEKVKRIANFCFFVLIFVFLGTGYYQPVSVTASFILISSTLCNCFFISLLWLYTPEKEDLKVPDDAKASENTKMPLQQNRI